MLYVSEPIFHVLFCLLFRHTDFISFFFFCGIVNVPTMSLLKSNFKLCVILYIISHSNGGFVDKPAPEDLQYFLEFQVPRQWAPLFCELPLRHQRKKTSCPQLQFSFMGPKIHVSSIEVLVSLSKCWCSICLLVSSSWRFVYRWMPIFKKLLFPRLEGI